MNLQTISQWNKRDLGLTPGKEMEKLLPFGFDLGSVKLSNKLVQRGKESEREGEVGDILPTYLCTN